MFSTGVKIISRRVLCPSTNALIQSNPRGSDNNFNNSLVVSNDVLGRENLSIFTHFTGTTVSSHHKSTSGPESTAGDDNEESKNGPSDHESKEDKRNPKSSGGGCYFCPFLLSAKLMEYAGIAGVALIFGQKFSSLLDVCRDSSRKRLANLELSRPDPPSKLDQSCFLLRNFSDFLRLGPLIATRNFSGYASILPSSKSTKSCSITEVRSSDAGVEGAEGPIDTTDNTKAQTPGYHLSKFMRDMNESKKDYLKRMKNMVGVAILQYKSGDKDLALKYLKSSADDNCSKALFNLAVAYETGIYHNGSSSKLSSKGDPDLRIAFEYYERASELNHRWATYNLALFYLYGKGGIQKDISRGTQLLQKAQDLGIEDHKASLALKKLIESSRQQEPSFKPMKDHLKVPNGLRSVSSAPNLTAWSQKFMSTVKHENSSDGDSGSNSSSDDDSIVSFSDDKKYGSHAGLNHFPDANPPMAGLVI